MKRRSAHKVSDAFIAAQRITNPQTAAAAFADLARTAPKGYGAAGAPGRRPAPCSPPASASDAIDLYKQIAKDDSGTDRRGGAAARRLGAGRHRLAQPSWPNC